MGDVNVQVRFTVHDDETGTDFTDALYYPLPSWPVPDAQVAADKQVRFDAWKTAISTPAPTPEPAAAAVDVLQQAWDALSQAMDAVTQAQQGLAVNGDTSATAT